MAFDPVYISTVLRENFKDAKALFLEPLLRIHHAHLVMLSARGIIPAADARILRQALDSVSSVDVQASVFDERCEDLFFHVESIVSRFAGEDIAGRLHTARSRNDIDMTLYRMRQREFLVDLITAVLDLRRSLLDVASKHRHTVYAALTHTQPAQPTTIAHYMLAVIEQLERDTTRLRAAFSSTNRCPLGSCAITGTGFPIDRQLTSDLLGFDGPTGNTYSSIATVDYLLESISATAVMLVGVGRVAQDLLQWSTAEFRYLRLDDGFVQCSSIMPQKRNPVGLEHVRAIASKAVGEAHAITVVVHNTPFGDIVDTEDDLQPLVATTFTDATRATRLLAATMAGAQFDRQQLEVTSEKSGTTLTELADHLVREHKLPFRTAHAISARMIAPMSDGVALSACLANASHEVIGRPIHYTDAQLQQILSAHHFVEVRSTHGGPAPHVTARAIEESLQKSVEDASWLRSVRDALALADSQLRERAKAL